MRCFVLFQPLDTVLKARVLNIMGAAWQCNILFMLTKSDTEPGSESLC
ncbi:hypothetical protein CFII68_23223 [Pseudomonas sp. CFII68]|nr:hypothetical protein CFII68_23223 [Pseudomonas sp. CFII68]